MCSPAAAAPHEDKEHMRSLVESLPRLGELFELHRKVGEGTFSSVFVGSLRADRRPRRLYAIKHLVPTAHPARIEHELRCLRDIGGQDHVIGVELCLRRLDTVVFVMPYIPHRKFSEYVVGMCAEETRRYMRALLLALRRVHHFGVIHRDVKPSNFLYDRDNQRYLLVDFGLAQRVTHISDKYGGGAVCVEASGGRPVVSQGAGPGVNAPRKRPAEEALGSRSPASKRAALSPAARAACSAAAAAAARLAPLAHLQADHPKLHHPQRKNATAAERLKLLAARRRMVWARAGGGQEAPLDYSARARLVPGAGAGAGAACACAGLASVCARCLARPAGRAPRAGTQGFRPPEVLLKYQHQTTAVDMWACGVILLCVLSGRYPFFRAPDDPTALAEFVSLFGSRDLQCAAHRLGRQLTCSAQRRAVCVRRLCARLRSRALGLAPPGPPGAPCCPHCRLPQPECVCCVDPAPSAPTAEWCGFPDSAFDLLLRLLDLNPHTRITAHDALRHPFLAGPLETSTAT